MFVAWPRIAPARRTIAAGPWGYEHLLEVLRDPKHEEHEEMTEWIGEDFDPEAFDPDAVNRQLK